MIDTTDRWCILRMSGPGTLRVATSLHDAGFNAWTPVETQIRRLPRSKKTTEREMAVMPTYVFAPAEHIRALNAFTVMPNSPHPPFSIFRYANAFPLIAGRSLTALRDAEDRQREAARRRRNKGAPVPHFPTGTAVKVDDGNFSGMRGVVTKQKGRLCFVAFPDSLMTWEIDALQLVSEVIFTGQP